LVFDGLSSSNVYATLTSPSGAGTPVNSSYVANDVAPFTLTEAGTYMLKVFATGQNTGAYSFRLLDAGAAPTLNVTGGTTSGTLTPGTSLTAYTFNGTAGTRLF